MKNQTILILLILLCFDLIGQNGKFEPFKLAVEKPNFAKIEEDLEQQIDTIEKNYLENYYYTIRNLEQLVHFDDYPEELRPEYEKTKQESWTQLEYLKSQEQEIKEFRYYELMSYYLTSILNIYFNEYEPYSEIYEIPNFHNDGTTYEEIVDSLRVDYIISFEEIKSVKSAGLHRMESRVILYSTVEAKYRTKA